MLWDSDPRTSEYCLLSGGAHCLPTASQLVSARLGINGALSLRHLCLWTFILSSNLLLLSGGLLVPASVNSCRTPGPSQAISASWLVVVKMQSSLPRGGIRGAICTGGQRSRYLLMQIAVCVAFARACRHSERVLYGVPWPPSDVTR